MEHSGHNPEQETGLPIGRLVSDILRAEEVDDKVIEGCVRYMTDASNRPQFTPEAALGCAKLWETYMGILERPGSQVVPKELQFSVREATIIPLVFRGASADLPPMTLKQAIIQVTESGRLRINRMEAYTDFVNGLRKLRRRVIGS